MSESSPSGQADANSPRHPAVGAIRSPEQRPSRACPTNVGGGDPPIGASLTANGDSAAAHTYANLYVEAYGSWRDAWAEVYGL